MGVAAMPPKAMRARATRPSADTSSANAAATVEMSSSTRLLTL